MPELKVATWADGFGRWHACVPVGPLQRLSAQRAIRRALVARGLVGGSFRVCVESDDSVVLPDGLVAYRERTAA